MPLTVKKIEKLDEPGRYHDEHGLYLQVSEVMKIKTWLFRYQRDCKEHSLSLGPLTAFDLEEARNRARKARQLLADGIDPVAQRREEKRKRVEASTQVKAQSVTFEEATRQYFNQHQSKWKNPKHKAQFLSTLKQYAFPVMAKMPVSAVDRASIMRVLDPIWSLKPETASRVRRRIEGVLSFAEVRGYRSGLNPARWKGNLDQVYVARSREQDIAHHRNLPWTDVSTFMKQLRGRVGIAARALEFLILTAARTSEVTGARWDEIDFASMAWTVPKERMKAKREHRVALSAAAIDLLRRMPREDGNPYIFVGQRGRGLSNMAMDKVLRSMGYKELATVHGFRATFRDWVREATGFSRETAEAALAHKGGDKVENAYLRGDMLQKRRKLMEAWSKYCDRPSETANVSSFERPHSEKAA